MTIYRKVVNKEVYMTPKSANEHLLNFSIDTKNLRQEQVRLLKSIQSMLLHVATTEHEKDFFEGSADLMRMCAALIKQANFCKKLKTTNGIPYANQALEYSLDVLSEHMSSSKIITYDN